MSQPADVTDAELREALRLHAPTDPSVEPHLRAALDHSVNHPGKLLRARLVFLGARWHGLPADLAAPLAAAVEFFHVASLLLDDLPCMDDAQVRRGLPCVHRVHGDATAILAALALINRAHVLAGLAVAAHPAAVRMRVLLALDSCLGLPGLVGGQARDLRFAEGPGDAREVAAVAAAKTGALLRLAVLLPALVAEPSAAELSALRALCLYWGQLFQVQDDLADVLASDVDAGKTTRRDQALHRPNFALALGVPAAAARARRLERQIRRVLERLLAAAPERWLYLAQFHATVRAGACASRAA